MCGFYKQKNESQHYRNFFQAFGISMCPINYLKNRKRFRHLKHGLMACFASNGDTGVGLS